MVAFIAQEPVDFGVLPEFDIFFGAPLTLSGETSQHLTAARGLVSIAISGDAFTYSGGGDPTSGTIRSIAVSTSGTSAYSFTGLSLDLLAFASAADPAALHQMLYDSLSGADTFTGSPFTDLIAGFGGRDTMFGGGGGDLLAGFDGRDSIFGGAGDDDLEGGRGRDKLYGGAGNDRLVGAPGKDTLDGGRGVDAAVYADKSETVEVTLDGSRWADVKVGGVREDTIRNIENIFGSQGHNRITGSGHPNTFLGGVHRDTLNGAGGADHLYGGDSADRLNGGGGNDFLSGGLGSDTLTGGAGRDAFLFSGALGPDNVDKIIDFDRRVDHFELSHGDFLGLPAGTLAASSLRSGAHAVDSNDFIIYDPANGKLFYDHDAAGGDAPVQFARLSPGLHPSHSDFLVVS